MLLDLLFELFGSVAQFGADLLSAEPGADDVGGLAEKVLADISEEVKVTDEIRDTGENLGHGFQDARSHVMD